MNVNDILLTQFRGRLRRIHARYESGDLQAFLDSQVEWSGEPVTAAEVQAAEAGYLADKAAAEQAATDSETDRAAIKGDGVLRNLVKMRPAEIDQFIGDNVTNLASARTMFKRMARILKLLAEREF